MAEGTLKYTLNLSFEEIKLPPFQDILILGKNGTMGRIGLSKSFDLLVPNGFETISVEDENVEAVFIHKRILKKITVEKVIGILKEKVFPYVSSEELIKVNFRLNISMSNIELA